MFYNVIILPIETIIDWVFTFCYNKLSSFGIISCIVGVSLVINFLALPIYNLADRLQEKERDTVKKLAPYVKRIKETFKGDEQFMILQTYYRQNNYHPLYALRSSLSILIEIPFFIAAYHYLSHCDRLLGTSFWVFKDLSAPDHLFGINILPVLMTAINIVSGIVYSRKAPLREQVQIYGIALVFLALLYNSPSGLVIYWILNNLFSLAKNIVLKTKHPGAITFGFICSFMILFTAFFWLKMPETSTWKKEVLTVFTLFFVFMPLILKMFKKLFSRQITAINKTITDCDSKKQFAVFILSALSLGFLLGFYLPSSVIATSPVEFSFLGSVDSPLYYIKTSLCMFFGLFVFWPCCIYFMFNQKIKKIMPFVFISLFVFIAGNIFVFKPEYGNLNPAFEFSDNSFLYEIPKYYSIAPLFVILIAISLYYFLIKKDKTFILSVLLASVLLSETVLSVSKINGIQKIYKDYKSDYIAQNKQNDSVTIEPVFHLSKTGKNIIIFFLDRAISSFFPYYIEQFPQLNSQYKGFNYYPNTVSYGRNTMNGLPPIMGGYEYTPDKINIRKNELLKDKHNEALKVMPKLFSDADYAVTVVNPVMANYSWGNDLSIFDDFSDTPDFSVRNITNDYSELYKAEKNITQGFEDAGKLCNRQIKNFAILQAMYAPLRVIFYNTIKSDSSLKGAFIDNISPLYFLNKLTSSDSSKNTFTFIGNDTPHSPVFLNETFDIPSEPLTSTAGNYKYHDANVLQDYDVNAAALLTLGKYFEYLQANDLYDNTRIVIVSDHGYTRFYSTFENFKDPTVPASFNPLFLFKDFDAGGNSINTDSSFMTNADTLYLINEELGLSNVNPYTGREFTQDNKQNVKIYPLSDEKGNNPTYNLNENQFRFTTPCWIVNDNLFEPENWKAFDFTAEETN